MYKGIKLSCSLNSFLSLKTEHDATSISHTSAKPISYPESSGSLVSGLVARRDSGEMEFFPLKSGVPSFSFPEAAILLASAADRDLWPVPNFESAIHGLPVVLRSLRVFFKMADQSTIGVEFWIENFRFG